MSDIETTPLTDAGGLLDLFPPGPPCMICSCTAFTYKHGIGIMRNPPCDTCKHQRLWHRDKETSSDSDNTTSVDSGLPGCSQCPCESFAFTTPIDLTDHDPKCNNCEHRMSVHTRETHHPGDPGHQSGRKCTVCGCTNYHSSKIGQTGPFPAVCTNCGHYGSEHIDESQSGQGDLGGGCTQCDCPAFALAESHKFGDNDPKCRHCGHLLSLHTRRPGEPRDPGTLACIQCSCAAFVVSEYHDPEDPDPPCAHCKHLKSVHTRHSGEPRDPGTLACTRCNCAAFVVSEDCDPEDPDPPCRNCRHLKSEHTRRGAGDQGDHSGGGRRCYRCGCTDFTGPPYISGQIDPTCTKCGHKLHEHTR